MDQRMAAFAANLDAYEQTGLDRAEADILKKLREEYNSYSQSRNAIINLSLQSGKNPAEIYAIYAQAIVPRVDAFQGYMRELADYSIQKAQDKNTQSQADFERFRLLILGIFITAITLFLLCSWLIAGMITKPVHTMVSEVRELADGDFRAKPRKIGTRDEIGQLAGALSGMRDKLREMMQKVNTSAGQVAASSEELTASAEQAALAANQIASSITAVAAGASEQSLAANASLTVVEQLSAGIQQIAANTSQAAARSTQAVDKAGNGGHTVEKAVMQMAHIDETVHSSAQVVAKLGERSNEIGQIVNTISGLAGQTNLLALNAAIEAARAGEQGRGFAVVAEEVRKLAEQSQDAAKKIAGLIAEIQADTDKAVVAMSDGTREVKTGIEAVNAAGTVFQEIAALVAEVSEQVKEISAAIHKMAAGSQQLVASADRIDELSKQSAGESQSVSAATEQQLASMEEIAASSEALSELARELQAAAIQFRV